MRARGATFGVDAAEHRRRPVSPSARAQKSQPISDDATLGLPLQPPNAEIRSCQANRITPAAASARFVLVTSIQTTVALFDPMDSAVGITEALIAGVLGCLGESAHTRLGSPGSQGLFAEHASGVRKRSARFSRFLSEEALSWETFRPCRVRNLRHRTSASSKD
jgi:hypothetical protein